MGNHRFSGPVAAYQGMAGEESGNDSGQVLDILNTKGRDWIHWAGSSRTAGVGKLLLRQWGEGGTGETRAGMGMASGVSQGLGFCSMGRIFLSTRPRCTEGLCCPSFLSTLLSPPLPLPLVPWPFSVCSLRKDTLRQRRCSSRPMLSNCLAGRWLSG